MTDIYQVIPPKNKKVPILVSVPHGGIAFPKELLGHYHSDLINMPDDTDFFIEKLYDFVTDMGITLIYAKYSRWVIDLNRSPENKDLYNDGRIITGLTPTTDFQGNSIYQSTNFQPTTKEVERRKKLYFFPYYEKLTTILQEFRSEFGKAILWDAHSIKRFVPTIHSRPFPDLILGTNDGNSCGQEIIQATKKGLSNASFKLAYNTPFKGGNITRHFGQPLERIHALQLEMSKDLYMDEIQTKYDSQKAKIVRKMLKNTFESIMNQL